MGVTTPPAAEAAWIWRPRLVLRPEDPLTTYLHTLPDAERGPALLALARRGLLGADAALTAALEALAASQRALAARLAAAPSGSPPEPGPAPPPAADPDLTPAMRADMRAMTDAWVASLTALPPRPPGTAPG